jgi:hypothetical protein
VRLKVCDNCNECVMSFSPIKEGVENANADCHSLFHLSSKVRFDAVGVDCFHYISTANLYYSIAIGLSDSERSFGGCNHLWL